MFKKGKWYFVNTDEGGGAQGANNAGVHSYSHDKVKSLAREICQNSLDAMKHHPDENKPVIVEFNDFRIDKDDYLGRSDLLQALNDVKEYYEKRKKYDKKEVNFADSCKKDLKRESIHCLRVSDFNTKGLEDSDKEQGDWFSLVKAVGYSDKPDTAGGSFGIGKHAAFAVSKISQVFYSTITDEPSQAFQGVTRFPSFKAKDGFKNGVGYFGKKDYKPLKKWHSLDPSFIRNESGTDLFIMDVDLGKDWEEQVAKNIIDNFFVSILENRLVVKINEITIDSKSIHELMHEYQDYLTDNYTYEFYIAYSKAKQLESIYSYSLFESDDVELRLFFNNQDKSETVSSRRINVTRQNGMKIFEKAHMPKVDFSGVLILRGDEINKFFRKLETPQHDRWSTDYAEDPKEAQKKQKELFDFAREVIKKHLDEVLGKEINAEGLSDFLPEYDPEGENQQEQEALTDFKIKTLKVNSKTIISNPQDESSDEPFGTEIQTEGAKDENGEAQFPPEHNEGEGSGNGHTDPGVEGDEDMPGIKYVKLKPQKVRVIKSDSGYRLIFTLKRQVQKFQVKLNYLGEVGNRPLKIDAVDYKQDIEINTNSFIVNNNHLDDSFRIDVSADNEENWSVKVDFYEIKSE